MKDETLRTLNAINRAFYRDSAPSFDATRDAPWPGWKPLLPLLKLQEDAPLRILDLGCGNGRFSHFLSRELSTPFDYTGLDASDPLLQLATQHAPATSNSLHFARWDFVEDTPPNQDRRLPGSRRHVRLRRRFCCPRISLGGFITRLGVWALGRKRVSTAITQTIFGSWLKHTVSAKNPGSAFANLATIPASHVVRPDVVSLSADGEAGKFCVNQRTLRW